MAGITQSPAPVHSNTDPTTDYGQVFGYEVGAIIAYPYSNGSKGGGIINVIGQGTVGPTGATLMAIHAIELAAQNPGPISIFAFSGGTQAFTQAWNYLPASVQSRIESVTYIDPGSLEAVQGGSGTVDVWGDYSDAANVALHLLSGPVPFASVFHSTHDCGHSWNCVFQKYSEQLSVHATYCPVGAGSVFGSARLIDNSGGPLSFQIPFGTIILATLASRR